MHYGKVTRGFVFCTFKPRSKVLAMRVRETKDYSVYSTKELVEYSPWRNIACSEKMEGIASKRNRLIRLCKTQMNLSGSQEQERSELRFYQHQNDFDISIYSSEHSLFHSPAICN